MISQLDYQLKMGESIPDYTTRIAGLRAAETPAPVISMAGQNQAIASSDLARNQYNNNLATLPQLEGQFVPGKGVLMPDGTYTQPEVKSETQTPPIPPATFNISTGNPALKTLFDSTNKMLQDYQAQGGAMTPEMQQRIQAINDAELQKQGAVAGARTAADNKQAPELHTNITAAKTAQDTQQTSIQGLLAELKTARESYISSLVPTQAEQDLGTKLNTLRTKRQLLPIELRQEGISAPGIAGRQVEDERVRAIQEQNLLLELGLKQDARKMTSLAYEKQVGFIGDDIDLTNKIQQQLQDQEDKVLEQARNLRQDSLAALADIVDEKKGWGGLAWTDLDPQSQADLTNLIKPYPDLTVSMISDALKVKKQQQVFDNAIKMKNAQKAGTTPTDIKAENYDKAKQEAIKLFEADQARNADKKINPDLYEAIRNKIPSTLKDDCDRWTRDAGYLSSETQKRFGILDAKSDIGSVLDAFLQAQTPKEE